MQSVTEVRDRLHTNDYAVFFLVRIFPVYSMPVTSMKPMNAKSAAERK